MKLTQERVRELFDYKNGCLIWKISTGRRTHIGDVAGLSNSNKGGYKSVGIDNHRYYLHRIIWLWHCGYFPEHAIDHINQNKLDNCIENLREVTLTCNNRNVGNKSTNTSGVKGVSGSEGKWHSGIMVNRKGYDLGTHEDLLEAACHRLAAEQAFDWAGCDSSSPAYRYVQQALGR